MSHALCDPRLNAVASLKLVVVVERVRLAPLRDPRLNAVASLKLYGCLLGETDADVIHGLMPWPH